MVDGTEPKALCPEGAPLDLREVDIKDGMKPTLKDVIKSELWDDKTVQDILNVPFDEQRRLVGLVNPEPMAVTPNQILDSIKYHLMVANLERFRDLLGIHLHGVKCEDVSIELVIKNINLILQGKAI